jgi:hypothetical protein
MRLSVVRPIETRKFIAVSRQYLHNEEEAIGEASPPCLHAHRLASACQYLSADLVSTCMHVCSHVHLWFATLACVLSNVPYMTG